jgi:hypothetical protein
MSRVGGLAIARSCLLLRTRGERRSGATPRQPRRRAAAALAPRLLPSSHAAPSRRVSQSRDSTSRAAAITREQRARLPLNSYGRLCCADATVKNKKKKKKKKIKKKKKNL